MCSFATGAGSRVMTSAIGRGRVRGVTLEKKLIFCSCTVFVFHLFSLLGLSRGVTQIGLLWLTAQCSVRRFCLNGPRLQFGHQRRQGANILRNPTGAGCDRNGNAGVEAVIGGSGILANIDSHLVPKSLIYMPPTRDSPDQT